MKNLNGTLITDIIIYTGNRSGYNKQIGNYIQLIYIFYKTECVRYLALTSMVNRFIYQSAIKSNEKHKFITYY